MLLFQGRAVGIILRCKKHGYFRWLSATRWRKPRAGCGGGALPIGISQLGARRGGVQSLTGPGGIMIDQIQEKRMGPRLSVLGILALCLIFWAAFVTLVLNW